jgi:hypothetical protein
MPAEWMLRGLERGLDRFRGTAAEPPTTAETVCIALFEVGNWPVRRNAT